MGTQRQIESARRNGARSRGPVTAEGKRRSSRNAVTHGLSSKAVVVLANESPEGFQALAREYVQRFAPLDGVELGIIEEMASTFWRIRRAWAIETGLFDKGLDKQPPGNEMDRLASAFWEAAASPQLALLHRYEVRLHRMFQRALQNLLLLKNIKLQNEPDYILENQRKPTALPAPEQTEQNHARISSHRIAPIAASQPAVSPRHPVTPSPRLPVPRHRSAAGRALRFRTSASRNRTSACFFYQFSYKSSACAVQ